MDTKEIRCPSGLRGRIRKLLGRDFHSVVNDSPDEATPDVMAGLAEAVWVETIDPGPYRIDGDSPMFRSDVLVGDRSSLLIQSRVFTSGGKRPIRIQCPGCGAWWPDIFDYGAMETREWPESDAVPPPEGMGLKAHTARKRFAAGEPCSTTMPDGIEVNWWLLTGSLLTGAIREFAMQFGDGTYPEMAARVHSIEGLDLEQISKPEERRAAIFERLTNYTDTELWDLWEDIQDHECGPETDVQKQCPRPACSHKFGYQTDTLGFIVPDPRMRSMRSRAGARRQMT